MSDLLRLLIAPLVWLAAFSAVYGLQGFGCATELNDVIFAGVPLMRAGLILVWVLTIATLVGILVWLERSSPILEWTSRISRITAWVAIVASVWALFPVTFASICS
ncbi:hypothetical protein [Microbulbifer elongatus]|uniref:Uncharacterized protein n=1 Tax=Microbulbifer elongatus TaxID=86173 RepID=A0ABT1P0X0_9GAMM|nr:hypothetical protein [Microbulbifer elongatus]MCQ3829750.1 hypothetical protein [Microbulbifer elongatus]